MARRPACEVVVVALLAVPIPRLVSLVRHCLSAPSPSCVCGRIYVMCIGGVAGGERGEGAMVTSRCDARSRNISTVIKALSALISHGSNPLLDLVTYDICDTTPILEKKRLTDECPFRCLHKNTPQEYFPSPSILQDHRDATKK